MQVDDDFLVLNCLSKKCDTLECISFLVKFLSFFFFYQQFKEENYKILSNLTSEFLIDQHHKADVGCNMTQIWHEAFIETGHSFVPPSLFDAIPSTLVIVILILQPCSNHLIRICCCGRNQLRNSSKCQIFGGCLKMKRKQKMSIFKANLESFDKFNVLLNRHNFV